MCNQAKVFYNPKTQIFMYKVNKLVMLSILNRND